MRGRSNITTGRWRRRETITISLMRTWRFCRRGNDKGFTRRRSDKTVPLDAAAAAATGTTSSTTIVVAVAIVVDVSTAVVGFIAFGFAVVVVEFAAVGFVFALSRVVVGGGRR
jgi:hypothetical protein